MIITIDTAQPLSKTDVLLLAHLVADTDPKVVATAERQYNATPTGERVEVGTVTVPVYADVPGPTPTTEETTGPIGLGIQENAGEPAAEPVAEEKPKRKRRTKAEMEAARAAEQAEQAEQADEPEEAPADLPAPPEATSADDAASPTVIEKFRAEAVELATNMVAQGQRPKVIEALKAIGALKVSAIPDDKLAAFLAELKS